MARERGLIRIIFNNFINSLRPRQVRGTEIGKDRFGNKYFEIPADPKIGRRKASRWFVPEEKEDFEKEKPAEWESWLRGRRHVPPTEDEILKNQAISDMKKKNAAELEAKDPTGKPKPIKEGTTSFPKYDEYEIIPGNKPPKRPDQS